MKYLVNSRVGLSLFACIFILSAHAQMDSAEMNAPYRKNPGIPQFDLLKADSTTHITRADIKPHQKTIIMFFSPECSHCQHQTEDIIAGMDSLKDVQIIMATYQPFNEMKTFGDKYNLGKYPNIKMGRDIRYFFPTFYQMKSLPHLSLYDTSGKYLTAFEGNQKVATLVKAFEGK